MPYDERKIDILKNTTVRNSKSAFKVTHIMPVSNMMYCRTGINYMSEMHYVHNYAEHAVIKLMHDVHIAELHNERYANVKCLQHVRALLTSRNTHRCNSYGLSVRLSVRPSVIFRCFVQLNEDSIVWFAASGKIVLGEVKFIRIFAEEYPSEGVKVRHSPVTANFDH